MSTVLDDKYEELAAQFQFQQIVILKNTLKKYGVVGEVAKEICGDFSFDLAMLLDQGEIDSEGETYRPSIAFTADEKVFFVQTAEIEFHDYAYGTTAEVFESSAR